MSQESLELFRRHVLQDVSLQRPLREAREPARFVTLLVALGREQGYSFTAAEVEAALQAARRDWMERWI